MANLDSFVKRKRQHIQLSLGSFSQAIGQSGLDQLELIHDALPEIDFDEVDSSALFLGDKNKKLPFPFFVSGMTAGHESAQKINQTIAYACQKKGWVMGVGSQRRQLCDRQEAHYLSDLRQKFPDVIFLGNIGLSQLIDLNEQKLNELVSSLGAQAMVVHLNSLQECFQPEGTPQFRGGLAALKKAVDGLSVPVIVKETGCGFSSYAIEKLKSVDLSAIDVSGKGGTHWGRIEGKRNPLGSHKSNAAKTFSDWGVSTVDSVLNAVVAQPQFEIWASGGVRSGLDAAKLVSLGADLVGFAQPIMKSALLGESFLVDSMQAIEYEFKVALFCTGSVSLKELKTRQVWQKKD